MVRMDKPYTFEGQDGTVSLLDLFEGRPQLVMHHFMFGPDWDEGCSSCSSAADGIGRLRQLHVRNTTLVAVSRAPYPKLAAFRERMGWEFPWYSSYGNDFNYDFHTTLDDRVAPVLLHFRTEAELAEAGTPWTGGPWTEDMNDSELPGISAFLRVGDEVFHTYSTYGRGIEEFHNSIPAPRPDRPRPPGGVGGTAGTRRPARPAGRRSGDAPARRVRRGINAASRVWSSTVAMGLRGGYGTYRSFLVRQFFCAARRKTAHNYNGKVPLCRRLKHANCVSPRSIRIVV